ncbi:MAG: peptidylprolyl isomerase [Candidatus Delongbacteria bacterium]|nr:peptidylprolyl isomerase [Candidatus Delongbacteria bacterium]MBN2833912.1 peptidylprolyl isomerase [Candidatus Delongbacteria bacterium]
MISINDFIISEKEFDIALVEFKNQTKSAKVNMGQLQYLADQLIDAKLLLDEAVRSNFIVAETDVDNTIANIVKQLGSEENFEKYLSHHNIDLENFKNKIKGNITLSKFIQANYIDKINVSEEDVMKYYKSNPDKFKVQAQVKASHILFNKTDLAAAESVKEMIDNGENFAELAKEHSQCPSGQNGGDLGYFGKGQMVKEFEEASFEAEVNKVVGPVKTQFGYHLILVTDKIKHKNYEYDEVRENLTKEMKNQIVNHHIKKKVDELRKQSKIAIDMIVLNSKAN